MEVNKQVQTRVTSAIFYGAVFVLALFLAYWRPLAASLLWLVLASLMSKELANLLDIAEGHPARWILRLQSMSFLLFIFYGNAWTGLSGNGIFRPLQPILSRDQGLILLLLFLIWQIVCSVLQVIASFLDDPENGVHSGMRNVVGGFYLSFPLFAANAILFLVPYGWTWLVVALVTPWASDSLAWMIGRKYGSTKVFPRLSPNKSLEGCVAALLGTGVLYIILYFLALLEVALPFYYVMGYAVLGICASLFCQLGDLYESALKRAKGTKDSGELIPGHGGILDRFDSSLFLLPFMFLVLAIGEFI
ncbi:MAG: phosphatidate cytidylyltransferase [Eubacteriales bacterium]|nr:phosphatidate cytidylyltransferase [Eubacteriales bacterium]